MIYVFCGHDFVTKDHGYINSIECLRVSATINNPFEEWKVIDVDQNLLSERINPMVASIGPNEILILGGQQRGK